MKQGRKAKKCQVSETVLKEIAIKLKEKFYTGGEISRLAKTYNYPGSVFMLLSLLEARGYLFAEETLGPGSHGNDKVIYKIVTADDYTKYEEEKAENAKRRLLATISG